MRALRPSLEVSALFERLEGRGQELGVEARAVGDTSQAPPLAINVAEGGAVISLDCAAEQIVRAPTVWFTTEITEGPTSFWTWPRQPLCR